MFLVLIPHSRSRSRLLQDHLTPFCRQEGSFILKHRHSIKKSYIQYTLLQQDTMFEFQQLAVYRKAKSFNETVYEYLNSANPSRIARDQLARASFSVVLNIAEGSGRFSPADRRNFFVIARGSVFECVAVFEFLKEERIMNEEVYIHFYEQADELSRMLFSMIRNLS